MRPICIELGDSDTGPLSALVAARAENGEAILEALRDELGESGPVPIAVVRLPRARATIVVWINAANIGRRHIKGR